MTKENYSDLTLILDRSGSMSSIKDDVIGGINTFIEEQKKVDGNIMFTLVQFDSVNSHEVIYNAVPINKIKDFKHFKPRSLTPLLDAVGTTIVETGERFSKMKEMDRPSKVVIIIFTDGYENASKEYNKKKIKEMVEHQTKIYNWQFIFLGANIDAFAEGFDMGFSVETTSDLNKNKSGQAMKMTAEKIASYCRSSGNRDDLCYSDEDRKSLQ